MKSSTNEAVMRAIATSRSGERSTSASPKPAAATNTAVLEALAKARAS